MRAVKSGPQGVVVTDVDEPEGDGVLVKVAAVSICASDFIYMEAGSRQIIGHEIAGTTEDGRAVAVEGIFGCGTCALCQEGRYNLCERCTLDVLGMTVPGGMSEYFRAPERALVELPGGLAPRDASLVEPCSVAWHACRLGGAGAGKRVAVVGGGAIGLLAVVCAKALGAEEVALAARQAHQDELGERFGAARPSGLYDIVIEAAGTQSGLHRSVELARPGGTVAYVGVYPEAVVWPHQLAFAKEVAIVPSLGYSVQGGGREFEAVARLLAARPDVASGLITHRFGIEGAPQAFATARDRSKGSVRVVVHPGE